MRAEVSNLSGHEESGGRADVILLGKSVPVAEGEFVPMAMTVEVGRSIRVSMPLGAFTVNDNRARFIATVDVVGLTAVVMGVGVGALGVGAIRPVLRAIAERIRGS